MFKTNIFVTVLNTTDMFLEIGKTYPVYCITEENGGLDFCLFESRKKIPLTDLKYKTLLNG